VTARARDGAVIPIFVRKALGGEPLTIAGDVASTRVVIGAGEKRDLVVAGSVGEAAPSSARIDAMLEVSTAFWQEWIGYCRYEGPYRDVVGRSALLLAPPRDVLEH
jgi:hypothetical protein